MALLDSFPDGTRVAVIGASGGIGRAIAGRLADCPRVASVHAFSRSEKTWDNGKVIAGHIDIEDENSIRNAAETASLDGALDLVIVTTGILWVGDDIRPEKAMKEIDAGSLAKLLTINAIGPAMVAKHFLPKLRKQSKTVFAALSARVGSIGDNRLGGWYAYRASKSALNMLLKTLSIEHARQWPDSVVAGLHPGTVDTSLSEPFTGRTPKEKLFSVEQSADYLLDVIDGLDPADSGGIFAWDGSRIEY
ncbi:MAG: SDR family NAD(P)-dependent oxidoreductase [Gammaproteobacteria bacterium]|nr:SDR family NAD(P)-dependent oxidoreductase [Gammaproteobacteria bacterium]